jgi:hypothetical protein
VILVNDFNAISAGIKVNGVVVTEDIVAAQEALGSSRKRKGGIH